MNVLLFWFPSLWALFTIVTHICLPAIYSTASVNMNSVILSRISSDFQALGINTPTGRPKFDSLDVSFTDQFSYKGPSIRRAATIENSSPTRPKLLSTLCFVKISKISMDISFLLSLMTMLLLTEWPIVKINIWIEKDFFRNKQRISLLRQEQPVAVQISRTVSGLTMEP